MATEKGELLALVEKYIISEILNDSLVIVGVSFLDYLANNG